MALGQSIRRFSNLNIAQEKEEADKYVNRKDEIGEIARNLSNMRNAFFKFYQYSRPEI